MRFVLVFSLSFFLLLACCSCAAGPKAASLPATSTTKRPEPTASPAPTPLPTPTPEPTPTPLPTPTPTPPPPVTDPDQLYLAPADLPAFEPGQEKSANSWQKKVSEQSSISWWLFDHNQRPLSQASPAEKIAFGAAETFTDVEGVLTFRGNHHRDAPAWGEAEIKEKKLEIMWTHPIGAISGNNSYWAGAGWTGQPLLVHWPEETRQVMGLYDDFLATDLVEVIYPVFDGHIYFLDLISGRRTRDPIKVGFGFKGTATADPRGYPLLYAGQGLNDTNGRIGPFRYRIFDLIENKEIAGIAGKDGSAFRSWGAFDASSLINWQTDTLLEPGENGLFYRAQLNTKFDPDAGTVSVNPELTRLRYKVGSNPAYGIESSPVTWRNYVFFSDNQGNILCLEINTLQVVWVFEAGDDSDATMVLEETEEGVFLYHGNTIDRRRQASDCQLRKLNALTGELIWQHNVKCVYDSVLNGGLLATPLLGKDDFSDMVIFNVCKTTSWQTGLLLALDKKSGEPVWERPLANYSWSSPVAIKSTTGEHYGIFCDSAGIMHLFDLQTGEDFDTVSLDLNCEASPAVYNDRIVVATYARQIYCVRVY